MARLSPRERDVARLVGQVWSNDEIANQLGKSAVTVKKQLRSVYETLDLSGRGDLISLSRQGLASRNGGADSEESG